MSVSRRIARRLEAARGYLQLGMADQALAELAEIEDRRAVEFEWYLLRGEALRERCDYETAIAAYQQAHCHRPDMLDVLMGLAWCYKRTGQLPKSIEMMQRAYERFKDVPIVLYNLSCYHSLAGNKELALSWLGRALRMQPDLRQLIANEADFDPLRSDADFLRLIELLSSG